MKNVIVRALVLTLAFVGILVFYGTAYFLHQDLAGGVLTGALAVDLGESYNLYNAYFPPIEKFWYMLAARLGNYFGVGLDHIIVLQTCLAVLFSASLGYVIRQRTVGTGIIFFIVPFVVFLIIPILYKNIFGLREHFVVLGLWPYLVLRAAGEKATHVGFGLRAILGVWMGFTLLFKYLYSIVVFFVEATDAVISRRALLLFRIENLVAASIVFIYLLVWLGFDPTQREAIGAMRDAISANVNTAEGSMRRALPMIGIGMAIWTLFRFRFNVVLRLSSLGLAMLIGAVIVAWMQGRWYTHHKFPIFMILVAWWWLVGASIPKWLHGVAVFALLFLVQREFLKTRGYQLRADQLTVALADAEVSFDGQRVALFNQHPSPFNEVILAQGGLRWSPQMNIAYVSSELKPFDTGENKGQVPPTVKLDTPGQQLLHGKLIALLESEPPDVLILDASVQFPLRYLRFQWEQVLSEDEGFQRIMAQFEPQFTHKRGMLNFTYYVRSD